MNQAKLIRRRFYRGIVDAMRVVWPVFSALLVIMIGLGLAVSRFEAWRPMDGVYFAFVTGLTVGYGDLVPVHPVSRIMAIGIGLTGVLLTALFAAISVRALNEAVQEIVPRQSRTDQAL